MKLELDAASLHGAHEIAEWLRATIAEEGDDRPTFRTIAEYILNDIEDALTLSDINFAEDTFGQPRTESLNPTSNEVRFSGVNPDA